jgi:hypothetical protein
MDFEGIAVIAAGIVRLPLDDYESGDNNYDYDDMGVSDGS